MEFRPVHVRNLDTMLTESGRRLASVGLWVPWSKKELGREYRRRRVSMVVAAKKNRAGEHQE
jgi:hypothetical protein